LSDRADELLLRRGDSVVSHRITSWRWHCSGVYPFPGMIISTRDRPTNLGAERAPLTTIDMRGSGRWEHEPTAGMYIVGWAKPHVLPVRNQHLKRVPVCHDKLSACARSSTVNSAPCMQSGAPADDGVYGNE